MKKRRKMKKKVLKTIIPLLIVLVLVFAAFLSYKFIFKEKEKQFLETIETGVYADITKYAIYGIHMNLEGSITLPTTPKDIKLVLSNGQTEIEIPWIVEEQETTYTFKTSEYINEGIVLEDLPNETLYLLIKTTETNEENEDITKYYSVENETEYENLEYYTLTKNDKNNKIDIEWNTYEECPTLRFKIEETTLPEDVYDITLDPGHDASDPGKSICLNSNTIYDPSSSGHCYNGGTLYTEADFNLYVSLALKEQLEQRGFKVIMTRDSEDDYVNIYEPMGSATMANDTKSKLNLAIHHNSSGYDGGISYLKGLEVYIANDTNTDLAEILVKNITNTANTTASHKELYKIGNGIYQRFFTEEEIASSDVQPSRYTTNTSWYYNMREIGGISTNASNDGRFEDYPKNEHYNSNNTAEAYLLELGYMDNLTDITNMINNQDKYAEAMADAIQEYLNQE